MKAILRKIYHFVLALIYCGDKYECPCCGRKFRKLRVINNNKNGRKGACWYCGSYERTRSYKLYLADFISHLDHKIKFLHIAPEEQLFQFLSNNGSIDYTAGDKRMEGYHYPKSVVDVDILHLPFEDNSFDFVMCSHVLEHIKDDKTAIAELNRVLKSGGMGIIQVPLDDKLDITDEEGFDENLTPAQRLARFGQFDHVKLYGKDFFDRLRQGGFEVEQFVFPGSVRERYGLNDDEPITVVYKH